MIAVEHPGNGLKAHKELSREVHVRPALCVASRRGPSLPQRAVLGDECLQSQIEGVEALGGVRHEARLPPAADTELFNFARGLPKPAAQSVQGCPRQKHSRDEIRGLPGAGRGNRCRADTR